MATSTGQHRMNIDGALPLPALISSRMSDLQLRKVDVVRCMGLVNTEKGLRRLDALLEGKLRLFLGWDPLESTCRHASLSIL